MYLSLPLIIYNFINTLSALPKHRNWAIRDLGQTFWGELFYLLLPWSKTTFISSSMMFFLPSLFTTFISEFLNHDPSSQLIGEVISSIALMIVSSNESRPFISLLVSMLFVLSTFGIVFGISSFKAFCISCKKFQQRLQFKHKKALLQLRAGENFGILNQSF
ncbi:hypothetical protein [Candidatus Mycoplasma haematominutum]|uniref:hypothetical protein n=1 Tax=Candidatus Mycoplasma haematominutum TaxID=209446 RepID=UPI001FE1ED96|nr:hypothetical protein [Candidatus Mycoplasma haematominutum]